MEIEIIELLKNAGIDNIKIENQENIQRIYNLFFKEDIIMSDNMEDNEMMLYYGIYYCTKSNYYDMRRFIMMAIKGGNKQAIEFIEKYYKENIKEDLLDDVLEFARITKRYDLEYYFFERAITEGYAINIDINSSTINKYYDKCAKLREEIVMSTGKLFKQSTVFEQYESIMTFLCSIQKNILFKNDKEKHNKIIPKYIKINIINNFL